MNIATFVKVVRKQKRLTQTQFGQLIWGGDPPHLVRNRIAKYETRKAMPPADVFIRIQALANPHTLLPQG